MRPEGRDYRLMGLQEPNLYVEAKGPNTKVSLFEMNQTIRTLRDAPYTVTPRPVSLD